MSIARRLYRILRAELETLLMDEDPMGSVETDYEFEGAFIARGYTNPAESTPRRPAQAFVAGDYYRILGVPYTATQQEIKERFHELAKQYHPDRSENGSETDHRRDERLMRMINEAYNCLRDPDKRARYNLRYQAKRSRW
ncbi:DnaJ domain-containing protein [bacterium]|nr:DnaJ domain-containing protein [candidate division CSSED10-310 bacterium]